MAKTTIKDVAALAGVSVGTVSKILNGGQCTGKRYQKVMDAIAALNYQPNLYARAVRSSRTNCIGLLMEKGVCASSNLWLEGYLSALLQTLAQTNYRSVVITVDSEDEAFDPAQFNQVDGLLSFGHFSERFWAKMTQCCTIPLVTYFENADYPYGYSFHVALDAGMEKLAGNFYSLGHREIAFAADGSHVAQQKMAAFGRAIKKICPEYNEELLLTFPTYANATETGIYMTNMILMQYPAVTAIIYVSDSYANGGLCSLMQQRLRLAQDISIASYDHTSWAANFMPRITGVGIDFRKTAQLLVSYLIAIIQDDTEEIKKLGSQQVELEFQPGNSIRNLNNGYNAPNMTGKDQEE